MGQLFLTWEKTVSKVALKYHIPGTTAFLWPLQAFLNLAPFTENTYPPFHVYMYSI